MVNNHQNNCYCWTTVINLQGCGISPEGFAIGNLHNHKRDSIVQLLIEAKTNNSFSPGGCVSLSGSNPCQEISRLSSNSRPTSLLLKFIALDEFGRKIEAPCFGESRSLCTKNYFGLRGLTLTPPYSQPDRRKTFFLRFSLGKA